MAETISHYFVFAGYSKDSRSVILLLTLTPLIIDVYTKTRRTFNRVQDNNHYPHLGTQWIWE